MADPIVGIDLGTSNTVVAHADEGGTVHVLADENGYKIHPSVVSFHPNGGVVVGAAAKQRKVIDPKNTIYSVKRLIGRTYNAPEVQIAKTRMPFQIKEGANQQPLVVTRGGEFAVPEVSAIVLDYARNVAAAQLGVPVNRAVVTVPASFNDAQRSATATAGAIAGLTVVRVLNEPTAAALAYGNTRNLNETIAVFDFGGGTFDITILKLHDQVYEVLGTAGDTFLGGDDLDERLVDRMVEKFLAEHRIDLRTNEVSMMRLRAVAEQTKIELSRRSRAVVRIDVIAYGAKGKPLDLQIEIKRDEFVSQVADLIDRTFPVCQEALSFAGLSVDKIDDVILVGGTTKIPYVRDQVAKFFARAPRTDINPEDAVAIGAGLQATSLERILGRRSPSKSLSKLIVPVNESINESIEPDDYTDAQATRPKSELPLPPLTAEEDSILSLLPPNPAPPVSRSGRQPTAAPEYDRPAARGQHHDRFEERTPAAGTAPLARMTKTGMKALAPPGAVPPAAPPPKTAQPKFTTQQPITQPRGSSNPSGANAIGPPPSSETPSVEPFDTQVTRSPAPSSTRPITTTAPSLAAPPPSPVTQPRVAVARPAQAPTMIMAPAPTTAATMMLELAPEPSPAATAKGFSAAPSKPTQLFGAQPAPSDTAKMPPVHAPSAASTAPGFLPPQTFPVQLSQANVNSPLATRNPVVLDVTPRGLGIATVAGYCEELIRRNSRVPTEIRKLFTTSRDDQDTVRIIVCQGESRRLETNVVIGDLTLEGLAAKPRGETSIEVTFQLDASGILNVRARDANTGKEQRAALDLVGAMPQADIDASRERVQALRR